MSTLPLMRYALVFCLFVGACASDDPVVMPGIESETDCDTLQEMFDTAERAADQWREFEKLDMARAFTDAMTRADARMKAVGCYG